MRDRRPAASPRDRARPPEERSLTGSEARFVGSFPHAGAPLDPSLPEVALIGRSNVGKSTLLNALAGRRIARVSATPGKTRLLNVYRIPEIIAYYLLDLPGYGWARAGKSDRAAFRRLISETLERPHLTGALWLLDVRREPSEDDRSMHELFAARETRVLATVTKGDKLPQGQRLRRERELQATLGLGAEQILVTSARTGEGIAQLREAIAALVR